MIVKLPIQGQKRDQGASRNPVMRSWGERRVNFNEVITLYWQNSTNKLSSTMY